MPWCQTCSGYAFNLDHHQCPPVWLVVFEGEDEDYAHKIRARDPETAAARAAHSYDSNGDYYISRGNSVKATVRGETGEVIEVNVYGEMVPNYTAEQIKP